MDPRIKTYATSTGDYVKVTCETSTLTQYFVVHNGDPIIHMATYITAGKCVLRFATSSF
jgi:hypothetical protein